MEEIRIERLTTADVGRARTLFEVIAGVFEDDCGPLGDAYLERLLSRADFWALGASANGRFVGGLTAYTLPMARFEKSEIFLYDIAVIPECQRAGVGRRLVETLRAMALAEGIDITFVAADNEDTHALDFYRALGGEAAPVTIFTFPGAMNEATRRRKQLEILDYMGKVEYDDDYDYKKARGKG
jgi:aminoglycoside 3-N-acetyltransferase I